MKRLTRSELLISTLEAEGDAIFRLAFRLTGNRQDAEDLVQDSFERALEKAPQLRTVADCHRWLLRVLHNLFIDRARRKTRSPIVEMDRDEAGSHSAELGGHDPEALAAESDSERALERAWARLDSKQQALLLLRAEGHSLTELSRITEVAKPALSVQLHRARSRLARLIAEERSEVASLRACSGRKI